MSQAMRPRTWYEIFKDAGVGWWEHNAFRYSAALAYYTIVSLAPLMLVVRGAGGLIFGPHQAREHILAPVCGRVGPAGADAIRSVMEHGSGTGGVIAILVGIAALLAGVLAVFLELRSGLNAMWGVAQRPPEEVNRATLGQQAGSLALVLAVGFLLLTSLVVTAALSALFEALRGWNPALVWLWHGVNFVVSLGVILVLFALMFKYLPDVKIGWNDVWIGAALTALLFVLGKAGIGLYLGNSGIATAYGAAGSVVVLLVWVYYSALIFFLGAEVTRAYATRLGGGISPAANATRSDSDAPNKQPADVSVNPGCLT
jgi:membrane protein